MDDNIFTMLFDNISLSIFPLEYYPLIAYILQRKIAYLYIFIGINIVRYSTIYIRDIFAKFSKNKVFYRPEGCKNCSLLNTPTPLDGPAFPSGHMGMATFLVITLVYASKNTHAITYALAILYVLLMGFARHYKNCHNIWQIIAGILHGGIYALLFIYFKFLESP